MRILALSGSLRSRSSNGMLLGAVSLLAPGGVQVVAYDGLQSLPHFNPDTEESELPDSARELREIVAAADAMLISSPEYAHGMAGSLKNALDWLVGSTQFAGMPVGVLNASPSATHAQAQLVEVLTTMSANVVAEACLRIPVTRVDGSARQVADDPARATLIHRALAALTRTMEARPWR